MHARSAMHTLSVRVQPEHGDRVAALFDTHASRLYRLARRLVPTADDALDLVQETFLRVARSPSSVPVGPSHEEAFLVRILVNVQRDQWRQAAVRVRYREHVPAQTVTASHEDAVVARASVRRALNCLPPRRRAVLVLHELEGLEVSAIAALLGVASVTVRWHLSIGRRELRRHLAPHLRSPS